MFLVCSTFLILRQKKGGAKLSMYADTLIELRRDGWLAAP